MVSQVNPPPQLRIPEQFLKDPVSREYFKQTNTILFQLYNRTGGVDDSISDADVAEKYPWPTSQLAEESDSSFSYPAIEQTVKQIRTVTTSVDYTAVDGDFINAKSNAQITLTKYPDENSVIIVRNGDGSTIKLNGNGKNMNGESTGQLTRKSTSIEFHYFIDSDEWFAR